MLIHWVNTQNRCFDHEAPISGTIDYNSCCESSVCPDGIGSCPWFDKEGYGGIFSSKGGINPQVYAEFDTPGEVATVYSHNKTIFAGLKYSNGCLLAQLNENGILVFVKKYLDKQFYCLQDKKSNTLL